MRIETDLERKDTRIRFFFESMDLLDFPFFYD